MTQVVTANLTTVAADATGGAFRERVPAALREGGAQGRRGGRYFDGAGAQPKPSGSRPARR